MFSKPTKKLFFLLTDTKRWGHANSLVCIPWPRYLPIHPRINKFIRHN